MPSYIQYMDTIQKLEKQGIKVKISDISDAMNLPRPGVTRTVKEMEAKGYLHKFSIQGGWTCHVYSHHRRRKEAVPEI